MTLKKALVLNDNGTLEQLQSSDDLLLNTNLLVYNVANTSYEELTYSSGKVTDIIIWTDNLKTQKVRENNLTYTGNKVTTEIIKQYSSSGSLVQTLTKTYSYTGSTLDYIEAVLT